MFRYALAFGGIGLGFLLSNIIIGFSFSLSGARLVERVRRLMFRAMLAQEVKHCVALHASELWCAVCTVKVGWYDEQENNTGALCARLSTSAEAISSATGGKIGQVETN